MPLFEDDLAAKDAGRVILRPTPLRVRWDFDDLVTADGHRLRGSFAAGVQALDDATERRMLEEVFLSHFTHASTDRVAEHFMPALRAALVKIVATQEAQACLASGGDKPIVDALVKAGKAVAFSCGVELYPPFEFECESPSFSRARIEATERKLAEDRAAGQVQHFQRAAEMLKQFESLRQSAPSLSASDVLQQISPVDRGLMLETLLMAAARTAGDQKLYVVAGPYLVKIDPRVNPAKIELNSLPGDLGPLRSVQHAEHDGQRILLVGARSGVIFVPADATPPMLYRDPEVVSQLGYNGAVLAGGLLWACHSDAGVVGWRLGEANAPAIILRPPHLGATPQVLPETPTLTPMGTFVTTSVQSRQAGIRNLQALDSSRLICSVGSQVVTITHDGKVTMPSTEAGAEIVAIIPADRQLLIVHEDGIVCQRDPHTLAVNCTDRRCGRVLAAAALPWLGSARLLLATEDGPVLCLGVADPLVTQYTSNHRGLRALAAAPDAVIALSPDRQRLLVWNSWDGRKPAQEIPLASITRHRVADVDFG